MAALNLVHGRTRSRHLAVPLPFNLAALQGLIRSLQGPWGSV